MPPYRMLKESIIHSIKTGVYRPGDRIPSEPELSRTANVARMTANRAVRELTDEGILERISGVGTFVARRRGVGHILEVRDISDEIRARGLEYSANVLIREEVAADNVIINLLRVGAGDSLYHTRIVHSQSGQPLVLEDRWVNPRVVPDYLTNDFSLVTPTAFLLSKVPLQDVEHSILAEQPDLKVREHLQMAKDEPCLILARRTMLDGRVITFVKNYYPASRYQLGAQFDRA